jgi:hypothetical protein
VKRAALACVLGITLVLPNITECALAEDKLQDGAAAFWSEVRNLCGKAFAGTVIAAPQSDTTFNNKDLVMQVHSCEKNTIRIPFLVGADRSRTWVLAKEKDRLVLKHEHRHEDGTFEKITQYGGRTTSRGLPNRQIFPADEQTAEMLPAAAAGVWWIDLIPGKHFTYNFRDLGTDKYFSIRFDLSKEIKKVELP